MAAAWRRSGALRSSSAPAPQAPGLCLHAWRLGFRHPASGAKMTFVANSCGFLDVAPARVAARLDQLCLPPSSESTFH